MTRLEAVDVDGTALLRQLDELARIGARSGGAVSRVAFTPEFVAGRDLVRSYMGRAGMKTRVDGAGNLFGRLSAGRQVAGRPGRGEGVVVVGSHLDTVPEGGLLDGAYGVLAGLCALSALAEVEPRQARQVVLAGFCNEEGAFGTAGMTGSRAVAEGLSEAELDRSDEEGVTLRERLGRVAGPGEDVGEACWPEGAIGAYLEVHIEQGPVMEQLGAHLSVVRAIIGRAIFDVELLGKQAHAGTTPMTGRADALAGAAEVVLAVERLALRGLARVATVGAVTLEPGSRNTVTGRARLVGELRDSSVERIEIAMGALRSEVRAIARTRGLEATVEHLGSVAPVPTDTALRASLARATARTGHDAGEMDSGAGHDAQSFAGVAPVGMLFVPSRGGVSHAGAESTGPEDLVLGAQALGYALAELTCTGSSPGELAGRRA